MFTKVLILCAVAVAASALKLPNGLHPSVCPNYPLCDMEILARHTPEGIPIPDWELPYGRMISAASYVAKIKALEYPPGVDPIACPNYPFCA